MKPHQRSRAAESGLGLSLGRMIERSQPWTASFCSGRAWAAKVAPAWDRRWERSLRASSTRVIWPVRSPICTRVSTGRSPAAAMAPASPFGE